MPEAKALGIETGVELSTCEFSGPTATSYIPHIVTDTYNAAHLEAEGPRIQADLLLHSESEASLGYH